MEWITSTEWLLVWWWWWVWLPQKWKLMPIKVGPSTSYLNIMDSLCKSFLISIITEFPKKKKISIITVVLEIGSTTTAVHAMPRQQSTAVRPVKKNLISDPKKRRQGETFSFFFSFFRLQEKRRRTFFSAMM